MSVDGPGGPLITAEALKRTATWGPGEQRQRQTDALVGVSSTVEATPRAPAALAALLVEPEAARARQRREGTRAKAPRAREGRRVASLVRSKPAVRERIKADAERRDPQPHPPGVIRLAGALCLGRLAPQRFKPWQRVTWVLDIRPVVGDLWAAANALVGDAAKAGQPWVQQQLTEIRRGRGGYVSGGRRPILTPQRRRQSGRPTLAQLITCRHNPRRWLPYDQDLALGVPVGTGVVESACGSGGKHRLEGEGQRWSRAGAEAILAWRSRQKSHAHDLRDDWRFHAHQVRLRLDGRQPPYRPTERLKRVASLDSKRSRSMDMYKLYFRRK